MIRLQAFVDDGKIARVLHALDGLVRRLEVFPVKNTTDAVTEAGDPTSGPEVIRHVAKGRDIVTLAELKAAAKTFGVSERSVTSAMHPIVHKFKFLRRVGNGKYKVLG